MKGGMPWNFREVFHDKMKACEARRSTFVMFGDWETWRSGFASDQTAEDGERYDSFCSTCIDWANAMGMSTRWLRFKDLQQYFGETLPLDADGWHFLKQARQPLRQIMHSIGLPTTEPSPVPQLCVIEDKPRAAAAPSSIAISISISISIYISISISISTSIAILCPHLCLCRYLHLYLYQFSTSTSISIYTPISIPISISTSTSKLQILTEDPTAY